jgi:hypothetical protein
MPLRTGIKKISLFGLSLILTKARHGTLRRWSAIIFFSKDGKTAWFDELLNTQMKICRGSGVVEKQGKEWKIKHYVLSMTVPNDVADKVIEIKAPTEDVIIKKLQPTK